MHEPLDPACSHCARFSYCFPQDSPLSDWGYCALMWNDGPPSSMLISELDRLARIGDYRQLYSLALGIYQETDDGCGAYEYR